MKTFNFFHLADLHLDAHNERRYEASLSAIAERVESEKPRVVVIAGDFWNKLQSFNEASAVGGGIAFLESLLKHCHVIVVKGNNEHDAAGSIAMLNSISSPGEFMLYATERAETVGLQGNQLVPFDILEADPTNINCEAIFHLVSYPTKSWILAGQEVGSIEEANRLFSDKLKALFMSMGAIDLPGVPKIFVGHFTTTGAAISEELEIESHAFTVKPEELALVGADYYALGDIHIAQDVSGKGLRNAYYPGNMYPVKFGESQFPKAFNSVKIEVKELKNVVSMERIDLPTRNLIQIDAEYIAESDTFKVGSECPRNVLEANDVKIRVKCSQEERKRISIERVREAFSENAVVEFIVRPTERLRSTVISNIDNLSSQVIEWMKVKGKECRDSIFNKAEDIERETILPTTLSEGAGFGRPLRLKLRGAIGIRDGIGVDEIDVDMESMNDDLVAITGSNGAGKTTFVENLHPFLQLASREGSLANHFYLRDSYRDFYFAGSNGERFRSLILIDAKTGKTEAFLSQYRDPISVLADEVQPWKALNDGKVSTYKAALEEVIGEASLFFRSSFIPQNAQSIAEMKSAERKSFAMELFRLARFDSFYDSARKDHGETEKEALKLTTERSAIVPEDMDQRLATWRLGIEEAEKETALIDVSDSAIRDESISKNEALNQLARDEEDERKREGKNAETRANIARIAADASLEVSGMDTERKGKQTELNTVGLELSRKKSIIANEAKVADAVKSLGEMRVEDSALREKLEKLSVIEKTETFEVNRLKDQSAERDRVVRELTATLNEKKKALDKYLSTAEWESGKKESEVDDLRRRSSLLNGVPCQLGLTTREDEEKCLACKFLREANEARETLPGAEKELERLRTLKDDSFTSEIRDQITGIESKIAAEDAKDFSPMAIDFSDEKKAIGYDAIRHGVVKNTIRRLESERWEAISLELVAAKGAIEQLEARVASLTADINSLDVRIAAANDRREKEVARLTLEILPTDFAKTMELSDRRKRIESAIRDLETLKASNVKERGEWMIRVGEYKSRIETMEANVARAKEIDEELAKVNSDLDDYATLMIAFSKVGVPALLLDSKLPELAAIANQLLESSFGSRFQISFETTRKGADEKKEIEDFVVRVFDGDQEKRIEDLSGGERVWVDRALSSAASVYRAKSAGKPCRMSVMDESDGALDAESKDKFLAMLKASHREGGRTLSFIISHTPELIEQIPQRINFNKAAGSFSVETE